jgi:hydrogenase maturation factor
MCLGEPATVVALDPSAVTARVDTATGERVVSTVLRPDLHVGDRVLVHTGFVLDVPLEVPGDGDPDGEDGT